MIKQILRSLRSLSRSFLVRSALVDAAAPAQTDGWLFEDVKRQFTMNSLPEYPAGDVLSEGECHHLDMLEASLSSLTERMASLRHVTRFAQACAEDLMHAFEQECETYTEASFATGMANRVADPVVTEILFGAKAGQPELDGDLFEVAPIKKETGISMPAYQIDKIVRGDQVSVTLNRRSGG